MENTDLDLSDVDEPNHNKNNVQEYDYMNDFDDSDGEDFQVVTTGPMKVDISSIPKKTITKKIIPDSIKLKNAVDLDDLGSINGVPVTEFDLGSLTEESKPWRQPGADVSEFFNYGFTEETWTKYCKKQKELRNQYGSNKEELSTVAGLGMDRMSNKYKNDDDKDRLRERNNRDRSRSYSRERGRDRPSSKYDKHASSKHDERSRQKPVNKNDDNRPKSSRRDDSHTKIKSEKDNEYERSKQDRERRRTRREDKENSSSRKGHEESRRRHYKDDSLNVDTAKSSGRSRRHSRSTSRTYARRRD